MSFLLDCLRADGNVIHEETISFPGNDGLGLAFSIEAGSEQVVDRAIKVRNSSGGTDLASTMDSPVVGVQVSSGSVRLGFVTTAKETEVRNSSGGVAGHVQYRKEGVLVGMRMALDTLMCR